MAESIDSAFSQIFIMHQLSTSSLSKKHKIFLIILCILAGVLFSFLFLRERTPGNITQEYTTGIPQQTEKIYLLTETDRKKLYYYRLIGFVLEYERTPEIIFDPDNLIPIEWIYNFLTERDYNHELYGAIFLDGSTQSALINSIRWSLGRGEMTLTKEQKESIMELLERVRDFNMTNSNPWGLPMQFQWTIDLCLLELQKYEP